MTDRYRLIRTEYEGARYHLQFDTQAKTLNGFTVCLPPYVNEPGLLVAQRAGRTMEETFAEHPINRIEELWPWNVAAAPAVAIKAAA